ncbi:MAG: hypothetical protein LBP75_00815 [Planctomycetota bacterium]|jgi:hypothetical protein|nr:hypothetical protein [Planctomycetota bacterium]
MQKFDIKKILLTVLAGISLPQVRRLIFLIFGIAIAAIITTMAVVLIAEWEDEDTTALGKERLQTLYAAVKKFQSEEYFARPPKNLTELLDLPPRAAREPEVVPLLADAAALRLPRAASAADESDFWLVPYYDFSLPANAIILLDRPGNYARGGHLVFNDGTLIFLSASAADYRRFAQAVMERRDRDFVRAQSAGCSIVGFKSN